MKILMLLEGDFPPDIRVENEIESLVSVGHDVHILSLNRKKKRADLEHKDGYTIHRKNISKFVFKTSVACLRVGTYFRFWQKAANSIISAYGPFDAVHVHDLQLAEVGIRLKQKHGTKLVIDLHENWPALLQISTHTQSTLGSLLFSKKQWDAYEVRSLKHANQIIVVVDEAKLRLTNLGIEGKKIKVVTNALNLKYFDFSPPNTNSEKAIFVYGGGITIHRGLQNIIKAIPRIKSQKPFEVWIIGDGAHLDNLKTLATHLNVSEYIKFWGWQSQKELLKLVSQANIALIPHLSSDHTNSTIPHKIFQYMYAEIPILSSNCTPLKRIIDETNSGWVYDENDLETLARTMVTIIESPDLIKEKGKAKHWVQDKYNWQMAEKELFSCYSELNN